MSLTVWSPADRELQPRDHVIELTLLRMLGTLNKADLFGKDENLIMKVNIIILIFIFHYYSMLLNAVLSSGFCLA